MRQLESSSSPESSASESEKDARGLAPAPVKASVMDASSVEP